MGSPLMKGPRSANLEAASMAAASTVSGQGPPRARGRKNQADMKKSLKSIAERMMTHGGGQSLDAIALKKEAVMREVLDADTLTEVVHIANSIPVEWLMDVDEIPGNVFRAWAFGILEFRKRGKYHGLRDLTVILVFLVQVLGPVAVVNHALAGLGQYEGAYYDWSKFSPSLEEWSNNWNANFLRMFLLMAYWMNGFISMEDSWEDWQRAFLFHGFLSKGSGNNFSLYVGAFTKCWCTFWCCIATFLIIGQLTGPLDVLYDILGMFFIYGLDSLGGDLNLVSEGSWPAAGLGWIEENLEHMGANVRPEYNSRKGQIRISPIVRFAFLSVKYFCFAGVLVAPLIHIMTPWIGIAGH